MYWQDGIDNFLLTLRQKSVFLGEQMSRQFCVLCDTIAG